MLVSAIVFAETGLLIGFFLPGDSLLLTAGVVLAKSDVANAILDCGWGKAPQAIEDGDGGLELVHRIERIIVPEEVET